MGTTLVSAVVRDDLALVSNVGDSRAYHITREGIRQVSRDHSVVEDMVEKGDLTRDEARHHPRRNLITRALGRNPGRWRRMPSRCNGSRGLPCCCAPTD